MDPWQVAELMAFMAQNRSLSLCKIIEVIAETTAALTPMGELLSKIPSQRVDTSSSKVFMIHLQRREKIHLIIIMLRTQDSSPNNCRRDLPSTS